MRALKVSEVNNYIKKLLSDDLILSNIQIEGEISNFKKHFSGHLYFSLKDDKGRIKCVMFKSDAENLYSDLVEGQKIIAKGYISIYEKGGDYQLYVQSIMDMGRGKLYKEFEELKNKLNNEGLFDIAYKKELPSMPKKIGIVTSATGAAIRDIINVINRRFPVCEILLYPSLVQGDSAAREIIKALEYLDNRQDIDLIIFGRGGGSIEELWTFNDEDLARTIFNLKTPNISAIGHETDFTIADFVSDLRAPTPSAAAEIAVPDVRVLINSLDEKKARLINLWDYFSSRRLRELEHLNKILKYQSPLYKIQEENQKIDNLIRDIGMLVKDFISSNLFKLNKLENKLQLLNPTLSLDRGHGIITNEKGHVLSSINNLSIEEEVRVLMKDGMFRATINEIIEGRRF